MSFWRFNVYSQTWQQTNTWSFVSQLDIDLSDIDETDELSFSDDFSYITQDFETDSLSMTDEESIQETTLTLFEKQYLNRDAAPAA
jgi:hypothetical protein